MPSTSPPLILKSGLEKRQVVVVEQVVVRTARGLILGPETFE